LMLNLLFKRNELNISHDSIKILFSYLHLIQMKKEPYFALRSFYQSVF
jgi:hypothetical protein